MPLKEIILAWKHLLSFSWGGSGSLVLMCIRQLGIVGGRYGWRWRLEGAGSEEPAY